MRPSTARLLVGLAILFLTPLAWAVTYSYDSLNRLTAVDYGNGTSQTYSYDAAGNLLSVVTGSSSGTSCATSTSSYIGSSSISSSACVTSASAWSAVSNASWITITSGSSGTGNGTVTYSVSSNTGSSVRIGTLTIGGQTYTISQNGTGANGYINQVQTMYIAYFGRPADPGGLAYYSNLIYTRSGSYSAVLDDFANSTESQGLYNQPTVSAKLDKVYLFLFGRVADSAGSIYWSDLISQGQITLSAAAYTIAFNAQAADAAILAAKQSAVAVFTSHLDTATKIQAYANCVAAGRTWLNAVLNTATASSAMASVDSTIAGLQTCTAREGLTTPVAAMSGDAANPLPANITSNPIAGQSLTVTPTMSQVQTMYIAYFGRPADPGGLAYYANLMNARNGDNAALLDDFAKSAESQVVFNKLTTSEKINQIYGFVFGRNADAAELEYWSSQVAAGLTTLPGMAYTLTSNAQSADAAVMVAKQSAAASFTSTVANAYSNCVAAGRNWLSSVRSTITASAAMGNMSSAMAGMQNCAIATK